MGIRLGLARLRLNHGSRFLEVRVPEFWPLTGPSLIGTAIKTIGPALELLGPGGLEKWFLTRIPSVVKES